MKNKFVKIGAVVASLALIGVAIFMIQSYIKDNTVTNGDAPIAKNQVNPKVDRKSGPAPAASSDPKSPKGRSAGGSGMVLDPPK